eukprot:GHRR01002566.1.p1 GENE.GHRR01002566.1~~GHRR01002566.1.p1  ORF type:complete len:637 (+),score=222.18 GHRR01002566.1:182-2092(+)
MLRQQQRASQRSCALNQQRFTVSLHARHNHLPYPASAGNAAQAQTAGTAQAPGSTSRSSKAPVEPPRPPELPLLMHSVSMASFLATQGDLEKLLLEWKRQHGPVFEFQVPKSPPVMVVTDPDMIREVYEVLQYEKSPRYRDLLPLLGPQSMVLSEGHTWRVQRDAFNPGFSSSFLQSALPGFISCTERLVEQLAEAADKQKVVQLHHLVVLTTLEIICKVGFGEDIDFLTAGRRGTLWAAFEGLGRHVAWFIDNVPFNWLKALPWNQAKSEQLQHQLDSQLIDILVKRLGEMGIQVQQQQQQASQWQEAFASDSSVQCPAAAASSSSSSSNSNGSSSVLAAGSSECPFHNMNGSPPVATSNNSSSSRGGGIGAQQPSATAAATKEAATEQLMLQSKDILTLAVKLCQQQANRSSNSTVQAGLDLDMLLSQMKTFFAAGHDTTAGLVGWTLWYLCQNPEVEQLLAQEVAAVMGDSSKPTYQQLTEMKYMNAVLKESLRIRPPIGLIARVAPPGSSLAGYNTSNKILLVSPYVQHMDEDIWGPDASQYKPKRWLQEGGRAQHVPSYSYMPFSRGPRDCIGARFALLEAKTILCMLFRQFKFEYAGQRPEEVLMSVTAHPKYGVPLSVKWREAGTWKQQ